MAIREHPSPGHGAPAGPVRRPRRGVGRDPGWFQELFVRLSGPNPIVQGLIGGLVITLLNALGALAVIVWRNPSERFLDAALGFGAGVMLYVISNEIIPETHRKGHARVTTFGTMLGIMVMLYLDVALG